MIQKRVNKTIWCTTTNGVSRHSATNRLTSEEGLLTLKRSLGGAEPEEEPRRRTMSLQSETTQTGGGCKSGLRVGGGDNVPPDSGHFAPKNCFKPERDTQAEGTTGPAGSHAARSAMVTIRW